MLRTHLTRLAAAVGLVVVAAQAARANFYLDVQYASGGGPGSTTYQANIDASDEIITCNVYVLITDPTAANPNLDGWKSGNANFFVGSGTLLGDVLTNNTFSGNIGVHTAGALFTDVFGTLGLGGSVASNNNAVGQWWGITTIATPSFQFGGMPYVLSGNTVGIQYLAGTITVSFTGHTLPLSNTTAPLVSIAANRIGTVQAFNWTDSSGTNTVFGTSSKVGQGTNSGGTSSGIAGTLPGANNLIYNLNGAGLNFMFTGSNPAALTAVLSISGPTTLLGGGTTSLTGNVTNSGSSPSNPLNWASSGVGVTLNPSGSNGVATGASNSLSGTLSANPLGFGPWTNVVTFSGTDAGSTPTQLPNVVQPLAFTVIGKGTTPTADGFGTLRATMASC